MYVSNATADTITEYAPGANGNVAPIATIAGSATGLFEPRGIAIDHAGHLWVLNSQGMVSEFAAGASGNVAPITTLSAVRLDFATHITFDPVGDLFVSGGALGTRLVEEFAAGATGNDAPIATLRGPHASLGQARGRILPGIDQLLVANMQGQNVNQYKIPADGDTRPSQTPYRQRRSPTRPGLLVHDTADRHRTGAAEPASSGATSRRRWRGRWVRLRTHGRWPPVRCRLGDAELDGDDLGHADHDGHHDVLRHGNRPVAADASVCDRHRVDHDQAGDPARACTSPTAATAR